MPVLLAWFGLLLACVSSAVFVWAPWAYAHGKLSLDTALMQAVPVGLLAGLAALFVVLVRMVVAWRLHVRGGAWPARLALVLAVVALAYPLSEIQKGARLPRIRPIRRASSISRLCGRRRPMARSMAARPSRGCNSRLIPISDPLCSRT
jgi:hypothetical protein